MGWASVCASITDKKNKISLNLTGFLDLFCSSVHSNVNEMKENGIVIY